jgi:hypothetical protein
LKRQQKRHQAIRKVHAGVSDEDGVVNTRQRAVRQEENYKKSTKKKHLSIRKVHDGVRDEDGVVNTRHRAVGEEENEVLRVISTDAILQQLRCQYLYFCTVVQVKRCSKHTSSVPYGRGKNSYLSF